MGTTRDFVVGHFPDRVEVLVTGRWSEGAAEPFRSGEADRLVLNYAHGFADEDLDFLHGLPIRQLVIVDRRLASLEAVHSLSDLELLHLTTRTTLPLDLTRLPNLRELAADWDQVRSTLPSATAMEALNVGRYGAHDLATLSGLGRLRRLVLTDRPRLRTLMGLSALGALRELGIHSAKKLVDIADLQGITTLEKLSLEGCSAISHIEEVAACIYLRELNIGDVGDIESLVPVRGLTRLTHLYMHGSTNVSDGDLSVVQSLAQLVEFRARSRRHYRPSVADVKAALPRPLAQR